MKKIKKRILLSGTILTLVLTGCSKNNNVTNTTEETTIEEVTNSKENIIETESVKQTKETETSFVEPSTKESIKETELSSEDYITIDVLEELKNYYESRKEYERTYEYTETSDDQEYITIDIFEELKEYLHGKKEDTSEGETDKDNSDLIENIKESFQSDVEEVKQFVDSEEFEQAKTVGKEYAIKFIDFLFYGKEINGVTINDCSDIVKQDLYDYLVDLDKTLMLIDEDYKEELGEKYDIVKEYTIDGYNAAKEYIIEQIGQEKYDEINSKKDDLLESAAEGVSSYVDRFINFLDEQYQNFKESDNQTKKKYIYKR